MICKYCQKENRNIAKFCKWCGEELIEREDPFKNVIGLDEVKGQLQAIADTYSFVRSRSQTKDVRLGANMIITGETGTGKTMLAQVICEYYYQHKIISKDLLTMVDAVDYEKFVENWDENIKKARGGLLFFDNAQKLLPDTYSRNVNPLDKLFVEMNNWNEDPIVIIAGLPKGLEEFFEKNPSARNRFKYSLHLPSYGFEEMTAICKNALKNNFGLEDFSAEGSKKLLHYFKYKVKHDDGFGNGHLACTTAEDIFTSFISRGISNDNLEVTEEDIRGYVPPILTAEEILAQLDEFVGAANVKVAVREIANEVQASLVREERGIGTSGKQAMHIVLTGNPGTGKTTIARKLGEVLEAIGYLDSGHVVEVDRAQMVSPYQGETPKLVDALCDKAKGGILFIDEAYTLAPVKEDGSKDEQGMQALEKLMKRMEDDRGQFVVIAAGYKTEMENLFRINPGIKSRFNKFLHIDDYNTEELFLILQGFVNKSDFRMDESCETLAKKVIQEMYDNRDKNFANGRAIREMFERMSTRQAERVHQMDMEKVTNEELLTFTAADVPYEEKKQVDFSEILHRFDNLVGMESVRQEITNLSMMINLQIQRGERNAIPTQHYVFTGNPGTGKTTVARIMADVLHALGIVSRGQLVEADRSKMVAGFTGQTAIKTNQLVDSALGGVLFIDEAYLLITSDTDTFGKEAVDTLLKRLEDDRGKFVCIVAGYTDQMHNFMESNPGLNSRFTQTIFFPDYNAKELSQIFFNLAASRNFTIAEEEESNIDQYFERVYATRQRNFGNARDVRKIFDTALRNQSKRVMTQMTSPMFKSEMMYQLMAQDIEGKSTDRVRPLDEVLGELEEFVGMNSVKEAIRRLAVQITFLQERVKMGIGSLADMPSFNIVLTGNPGTGKTSVARKLGLVLQSIGSLPSNKVIEVDRSKLVGKYQGETPKLVTNFIEQAMGGILFIDEAYTLSQENDQYGREAIETLMKRMEDDAGKFVVIAAGYQREMEQFLETNPGLSSRFNYRMNIPDYSVSELVEIFRRMAEKKEYKLSSESELMLMQTIMQMYQNRGQNFGNAREIRNMFSRTIQHLSVRVSEMPPSSRTPDSYNTIMPEDITASQQLG